jgi:hypothetical protein
MKRIILPLSIIAITILSCAKKCPVGPESPMSAFLSKSTFSANEPLRQQSVPSDEIGYTFSPKKNGKISELSAKIPNTDNDLPITLWDETTHLVLKTIHLNVIASDIETREAITPIPVIAGHKYVISMNTRNSYDYQNADNGNSYPTTVCNIDIINANYNGGFGTAYPGTIVANTKFRAFVNFTYTAD